MQITILFLDETLTLDVDASMPLSDLRALLEAETSLPVASQLLFIDGRPLAGVANSTLTSMGVRNGDVLELRHMRDEPANPTTNEGVSRDMAHDPERMRLQLLGNPRILNETRQLFPELARAAQSSSSEDFAKAYSDLNRRVIHTRRQEHPPAAGSSRNASGSGDGGVITGNHDDLDLDHDFNIESQRRIAEQIRQQRVMENMNHAIEFSPESFGVVTMLFVDAEVNGFKCKALVDSGAQATIMSPELAELAGLDGLIDHRFAGLAKGVGTAKILGRIHTAQLKLQDLYLPTSFTVMQTHSEGSRGVEMLFGLDMLRRHQACIDLSIRPPALIIQGRLVPFLSEHDIPVMNPDEKEQKMLDELAHSHNSDAIPYLGGQTDLRPLPVASAASSGTLSSSQPRHPPEKVAQLVALGASEPHANELLDATSGHVEAAASLLFNF